MIECSAHLRAKPGWFDKRNDPPGIVARWTSEAIAQGLTEAQIRYVLAELARYAELRDERTGIEVSAVDGVWQSDTLIDDELRSRLREAVRVLEEVPPEEEKDWHPGSDGQVLDLVHPSLFCLVRDVSGGPERTWENPTSHCSKHEFSDTFQWLPSDVEVGADGEVAFRSYVNNVHPPEDHRELTGVLPDLFARMLPLLENVLTDLRHPRPPRIGSIPPAMAGTTPEPEHPQQGLIRRQGVLRGSLPRVAGGAGRMVREPPSDHPGRPGLHPPARAAGRIRPPVDLRGRRLQVVVKLATIHLTPEKPEYAGGFLARRGHAERADRVDRHLLLGQREHHGQPAELPYRARRARVRAERRGRRA